MSGLADDETKGYVTDLLNQCRIELPGAADVAIRQRAYPVLHEFFNYSNAWTETIPVTTINGQQDYTITPAEVPPGQIIRLGAVIDNNLINYPADMPRIGTLEFITTPTTASTLNVIVIKTVARPMNADGTLDHTYPVPDVPPSFWGLWQQAWVHGIVGYMMMEKNRPYSDEKMGLFHLQMFRDGVKAARVAALRRNTWGTNTWMYPQQFRMRGQRGGIAVGNEFKF